MNTIIEPWQDKQKQEYGNFLHSNMAGGRVTLSPYLTPLLILEGPMNARGLQELVFFLQLVSNVNYL